MIGYSCLCHLGALMKRPLLARLALNELSWFVRRLIVLIKVNCLICLIYLKHFPHEYPLLAHTRLLSVCML